MPNNAIRALLQNFQNIFWQSYRKLNFGNKEPRHKEQVRK